jgi:hypothetical protein
VAADIDSPAFTTYQANVTANPFATSAGPTEVARGGNGQSVGVSVAVRRHPVSEGNFWITLLLLLLWPAAVTAWRLAKSQGAGKS